MVPTPVAASGTQAATPWLHAHRRCGTPTLLKVHATRLCYSTLYKQGKPPQLCAAAARVVCTGCLKKQQSITAACNANQSACISNDDWTQPLKLPRNWRAHAPNKSEPLVAWHPSHRPGTGHGLRGFCCFTIGSLVLHQCWLCGSLRVPRRRTAFARVGSARIRTPLWPGSSTVCMA